MEAEQLVADLFRQEYGRLLAALTRLLGPQQLSLAEDVVQDALIAAMDAWRFELPRDPRAWILAAAKRRAIDHLRRIKRLGALQAQLEVEHALAPAEQLASQLALMFAVCDERLSPATHTTLILHFVSGLSSAEIAQAFLVDVATIERRLHRGRARLRALGELQHAPGALPSVLQALYLLFNEGYHGSDHPLRPLLCEEALALVERVLDHGPEVHALAALFCFHAARLSTRLDEQGVFVPLAEQDRGRWDRALVERGVWHLGQSTHGELTRWHLEAGIAFEHACAPSLQETNWERIVELYDALYAELPSAVIALNRALAIGELRGAAAGLALARGLDKELAGYPFLFGALADLARRASRLEEARGFYERALTLARSPAERTSFERRLAALLS